MQSASMRRFGSLRMKLLVLAAAALSLSCSFVQPSGARHVAAAVTDGGRGASVGGTAAGTSYKGPGEFVSPGPFNLPYCRPYGNMSR